MRGKLECERRTTTVLTFKLVGKATLVDVDKRLKNFKFLGRSNQMERRPTPFRWDYGLNMTSLSSALDQPVP